MSAGARPLQLELVVYVANPRQLKLIYKRAARPYAARVRSDLGLRELDLVEQDRVRLGYAQELLPATPITATVAESLAEEARQTISLGLDPTLLDFLPQIGPDFEYGRSQ